MKTERPARKEVSAGSRTASIAVLLFGANALQVLQGAIAGPLQARGLGAAGRGILAALVVPMVLIPLAADGGLSSAMTWLAASEPDTGALIGSIGLTTMLLGCAAGGVALVVGPPVAHASEAVRLAWAAEAGALPLVMMGITTRNALWGLRRWRALAITQATIPVVMTLGAGVLFLIGGMTVERMVYITVLASLLPVAFTTLALRGLWRELRISFRTLRRAVPLALKAWPGTLAGLANNRLDQLILIGLVSPRALGCYVVGASVATIPAQVASVGASLLVPGVAHEQTVSRQAIGGMRQTLLMTSACVLAGVVSVPFLIPIVFGGAFHQAIWVSELLLLSVIPQTMTYLASHLFSAAGVPQYASYGEMSALAVTLPGLIALVPLWGITGAAIVTMGAYSTNVMVQISLLRRHRQLALPRALFLPRLGDMRDLARLVPSLPLFRSSGISGQQAGSNQQDPG